jgi:hypothetical protein
MHFKFLTKIHFFFKATLNICFSKIWRHCSLLFLCLSLLFSTLTNQAYGASGGDFVAYEAIRGVEWNSSDARCRSNDNKADGAASDTNGIAYNPFGNNRDILWDFMNPTCIGYTIGAGLTMSITAAVASRMCGTIYKPSPIMQLSQLTSITNNGAKCTFYIGVQSAAASALASCNASVAAGNAACLVPTTFVFNAANTNVTRCCGAYGVQLAAFSSANAALAVIYGVANITYKKARICGHDWQVWSQTDIDGTQITNKDGSVIWSRGKYNGSYNKCLNDLFSGNNSCNLDDNSKKVANQYYREYIYGGKEYKDSGSGACEVPSGWDSQIRKRVLGYEDDKQRYYMRGPGLAGNYACNRFLVNGITDASVRSAYDCCQARSQNTICLEYSPTGSPSSYFCTAGNNCTISGVVFKAYQSKTSPNYVCAKTFSVCPYNHLIGGGTEMEDYGSDIANAATVTSTGNSSGTSATVLDTRKNFCQYMNHCVKVPITPYVNSDALFTQGFISKACKNLKGDSQNNYSFNFTQLGVGRNFAAPLVQCFKETMENLLLNTAADTVCATSILQEMPDKDGVCASGNYKYRAGDPLLVKSFFLKLQDNFQSIIKMSLVLAVIWFGIKILMVLGQIKRKEIMMFVIKIGLIMYFAVGNGWQSGFMSAVMGTSNLLADLAMKFDPQTSEPERQDGCQFPKFNYADISDPNPQNFSYPPGKNYLKIWDILDCKIARAIGFGPEVSIPNLMLVLLAGMLTFGAGIIFVVGAFCFAFFLILLIISAIHIFLISFITITLLIYISPITITLSLFERTKSIFENWWKQLLGVTLQPMILFAYLGVLITVFDTTIIGNVTFFGDGRSAPKTINCTGEVASTSVYCFFDAAKLKNFNALEPIGIGLPLLVTDNLGTKVQNLIKAALLMFVFTQFLNKIQELAAHLVGGANMGANLGNAVKMASKAYGALKAMQKRAGGALKKHGGKIARSAGNTSKNIAAAIGNRGYEKPNLGAQRAADKIESKEAKTDEVRSSGDSRSDQLASSKEVGNDREGGAKPTNADVVKEERAPNDEVKDK